MGHTFIYPPRGETQRVVRGYTLALALVVWAHWMFWYWTHRQPLETPAIVPQMVDVELIAAPRDAQAPSPPAAAPAPPAPPVTAKPEPTPKKPDVRPKKPDVVAKTKPTPTQKRQKAEHSPESAESDMPALRELRDSLRGSSPPPAAEASRQANPGSTGGTGRRTGTGTGAEQKVTAAHDAAYLHNPKPRYPSIAVSRNWEGVVKLRVYVLPNGSAGQVQLAHSSGHDVLDDAALETVQHWRFVPAKRGEQPIASWVQVPLVFKLAAR